jgi:septal ring factor EnvC (AmiA/AmiB activator)
MFDNLRKTERVLALLATLDTKISEIREDLQEMKVYTKELGKQIDKIELRLIVIETEQKLLKAKQNNSFSITLLVCTALATYAVPRFMESFFQTKLIQQKTPTEIVRVTVA